MRNALELINSFNKKKNLINSFNAISKNHLTSDEMYLTLANPLLSMERFVGIT